MPYSESKIKKKTGQWNSSNVRHKKKERIF